LQTLAVFAMPQASKASRALQITATLAVLVAAAALLNPSAEQHRKRIQDAVAERSPLAGALGVGALAAFVSNYHSVGLASYTSIRGRTVSVGFMGMVFVLDSHKDL
jgi:hypothetical protein